MTLLTAEKDQKGASGVAENTLAHDIVKLLSEKPNGALYLPVPQSLFTLFSNNPKNRSEDDKNTIEDTYGPELSLYTKNLRHGEMKNLHEQNFLLSGQPYLFARLLKDVSPDAINIQLRLNNTTKDQETQFYYDSEYLAGTFLPTVQGVQTRAKDYKQLQTVLDKIGLSQLIQKAIEEKKLGNNTNLIIINSEI